jgi:hypothetical protein
MAHVILFAPQYLIKKFENEFKMVVLDSYNMEIYVKILTSFESICKSN